MPGSHRIQDAMLDQSFDDITRLAARTFRVPFALILLQEEQGLYCKSHFDWSQPYPVRALSIFCNLVMESRSLVEIPDACLDDRVNREACVTSRPSVRFFAGIPLAAPDGRIVGSLCILSRHARRLTEDDFEAMRALALQAMALLELRRSYDALELAKRLGVSEEEQVYIRRGVQSWRGRKALY